MKVSVMLIALIAAYVLYCIVFFIAKKKKPFKRAFFTMSSGILALIIIDFTGIYTGVYLPLSAFSFCVSAVCGIPGIASMLIISNFM